MDKNESWDLNRLPTAKEKILGTILSGVILVLFSSVLYVTGSIYYIEEPASRRVFPIYLAIVFFLGALILFIRIVFSKNRRPTKRAIRITAYVTLILCAAMITFPLLVGFTLQGFYMLAIGITGIATSRILFNSSITKKSK